MRPRSLLSLVRRAKPRKNRSDMDKSYIRLFVTLSMVSIPVPVLYYFNNMGPSVPITDERRALLAIALLFHLVMHGLSTRLKRHWLPMVAYLVVQFSLLIVMSVLVNTPLILIFNTPLIGEVILVFDSLEIAFLEMLLAYGVYVPVLMAIYHFDGAVFIQYFGPSLVVTTFSVLPYLAVLVIQAATHRRSKRLMAELRDAHRQLMRYADQVEELTLTAERARMARDLHDTLAQGMAGVTLQLEALEGSLTRGDTQRAMMILSQVKSNARATLKDSRQAIDALRLITPQDTSGETAIRAEVKRFTDVYGIPCKVEIPDKLTLSSAYTELLLRCISEGLTNIGRHAQASLANLSLYRENGEIVVQLTDNGVGFEPETVNKLGTGASGHYGLVGMNERIQLVDGKLGVTSDPGKGTTLRLSLPQFDYGEDD